MRAEAARRSEEGFSNIREAEASGINCTKKDDIRVWGVGGKMMTLEDHFTDEDTQDECHDD